MNGTTSLYRLTNEYQDLYDAVLSSADEETGEVDLSLVTALAQRQEEWEKKAVSVACVYRALKDDGERVGREIERLTAIKKRIERERDRIKDGLDAACQTLGVESVKGMYANISYRLAPPTVVVDNPDEIPEEYIRVKVTRNEDKVAIREAIQQGKEVPGAHLEQKKNIQIK